MFTSVRSFDRDCWLGFVRDTPDYPVLAHPDVLPWSLTDGDALVYTDMVDGEIRTLGVMARRCLPVVPEWPKLGTFAGWRLVGDRLAGDVDDEALGCFARACRELLRAPGTDGILFEDLEVDGALWKAVEAVGTGGGVSLDRPKPAQPHWRILLPEDPAAYWQTLSGKVRRNLRRNIKHFPHTVEVVRSAEQVPDFLEAVSVISEQSWQGRRLGRRASADERRRTAFESLAELGALRCFLLRHDGEPVAFVYGWQWGGVFDYAQIGYDSRLAAKGPGKILLARVLEDLIERDTPDVLDFGDGDADYKRRFGTHHSLTGPLTLNSARLHTRVGLTLRHGRDSAHTGVRLALQRAGVYDRIRRAYRRT